VGAEHRYSELELHYHSNRASGRAALAAAVGLRDEHFVGIGPLWERAL